MPVPRVSYRIFGAVVIVMAAAAGCATVSPTADVQSASRDDSSAAGRLTVLDSAQRQVAISAVDRLQIRTPRPPGRYSRAEFGAAWSDHVSGVLWAGNGCSTRDDVLARDLDQIRVRGRCTVISGVFVDPYTNIGQQFTKTEAIRWPVDHVVPLSYAWRMGADRWSVQRREAFANDPLNLVVTTQAVNSDKADSGPGTFLPPYTPIRCAYVYRFTQVAFKYQLPVTSTDARVMADQCAD